MKVLQWPLSGNEILVYMVTSLINMKDELVPWFKTWYLNLFGFQFGKMKVLKWPLSRSLINGKFELVPWRPLLQTRYVNLFDFEFSKIKVLDWPLSRKCDFVLYAYNFYKWDVLTCPLTCAVNSSVSNAIVHHIHLLSAITQKISTEDLQSSPHTCYQKSIQLIINSVSENNLSDARTKSMMEISENATLRTDSANLLEGIDENHEWTRCASANQIEEGDWRNQFWICVNERQDRWRWLTEWNQFRCL